MKYLHITAVHKSTADPWKVHLHFWGPNIHGNSVELLLLLTEPFSNIFLMIPPNIVSYLSLG